MAKFLAKILLFFLLALLGCYVVELGLKSIPNEYNVKTQKFDNHGGEIKTLILGHSQTVHGLNPDYMGDSVFNAATPLQAPYYNYELLNRNLAKMPNLQCVIWPLCEFFGDLTGETSGYFRNDYNNFVKCMSTKYWGIPPLDKDRFTFWPELVWSHWKGPALTRIAEYHLGKSTETYPLTGYFPQYGRAPETETMEADTKPGKNTADKSAWTSGEIENRHYATLIAQLCSEHDLRLIVLTLPDESHNYDYHRRIKMQEVLDSIRDKCPNAEYYDYTSDDRFVYEDFFDGIHLNDVGATKFSKIVKTEVLDR